MILLTVGTQLPFDRLVQIMDAIAPDLPEEVYAQIGKGNYLPRNFGYCRMARPEELAEKFRTARQIVSHAGTGSLLTARRYRKPIILFPRRAALGEHRNDHQLATCHHLDGAPGLSVAYDEAELLSLLSARAQASLSDLNAEGVGSELGRGIANYIKGLNHSKG